MSMISLICAVLNFHCTVRQLYLLFPLVTGILAVYLPFTTHDNGKLRVSTSYLISFFYIYRCNRTIESLRAKLKGKNKSKTIYQNTYPVAMIVGMALLFFKEIRDIIRYKESETLTGVNLHFGHKWRSVRSLNRYIVHNPSGISIPHYVNPRIPIFRLSKRLPLRYATNLRKNRVLNEA